MGKKVTNKNFKELLIKSAKQAGDHAEGKITLKKNIVIKEAPQFTAKDIKNLRSKINFSQAMFAKLINVQPKTVQSWEGGNNLPNKTASRLLQLFAEDPKDFLERICS